jgi:hypothetical protein
MSDGLHAVSLPTVKWHGPDSRRQLSLHGTNQGETIQALTRRPMPRGLGGGLRVCCVGPGLCLGSPEGQRLCHKPQPGASLACEAPVQPRKDLRQMVLGPG